MSAASLHLPSEAAASADESSQGQAAGRVEARRLGLQGLEAEQRRGQSHKHFPEDNPPLDPTLLKCYDDFVFLAGY